MVAVKVVISSHRRFTGNHTWHVDVGERRLFLKANPSRQDAQAERSGYREVRRHYPVPRFRAWCRIPGWSLHLYDRWPHLSSNHGLLLDVIARAEQTGSYAELHQCLSDVIEHYRRVIFATTERVRNAATCTKLYGARAQPCGRLERYYGEHAPWRVLLGSRGGRQANASDEVLVNGRDYRLHYGELVEMFRAHFAETRTEHAAITQGDPTDFNIGWTQDGPIWFDYDTGGLNALPGEFACFLVYQRLHGAWLTPRYNPAAYADHPAGLRLACVSPPSVHVRFEPHFCIDVRFQPSVARKAVIWRYVRELVQPVATELGVRDVVGWLRPYVLMRLLGVYDLTKLHSSDLALCTALVAEAIDPRATLPSLLGLEDVYAPGGA